MELGVRGRTYQIYGSARYEKMLADGFSYCDLNLGDMEEEIYDYEEARFVDRILEERDLAEAAGIGFFQLHGPTRYPPRDATEEERAEQKVAMEKCFRAAKLLGCPYVVQHPLMPFGTKEDPDPERVIQMNIDFFRSLLPAARENGVTICLENMPMSKLSISYPESILRVVKEIDDPNFAFCLDTGHSIVKGVQPGAAVRAAGNLLKVLHVHDSDGERDHHWYPGEGAIDWADFSAALKEIGYVGVMNMETGPGGNPDPEQYQQECRRLAQIAGGLA